VTELVVIGAGPAGDMAARNVNRGPAAAPFDAAAVS